MNNKQRAKLGLPRKVNKKQEVINKMIEIYEPNGRDWMGYTMTEENPYTYHHILEKRNGGPVTVENGALLTKEAHSDLNELDQYCPEAYEEYQAIFRYINESNCPITEEMYEYIEELALDIFIGNGFHIRKNAIPYSKERQKKYFKGLN